MGTSLILQLDSSPNFFNRSQGYEDWKVLVAEEKEQIVASAGFAVQEKVINGSIFTGLYEYGFMVDPEHRRKGIASRLQEEVELYAQEADVDFLHLNITEDNLASHGLFTKHGFHPVRKCSPMMFMAYKKHETEQYSIRTMREGDIPVVTTLLNEYYHDHDFYTPFTEESFKEHFSRLPFYRLEDIYLFEFDTVKAVAGIWDYNELMHFTLQGYNSRWRLMAAVARLVGLITPTPRLPLLGEQMTNWYLTPFAYRDPKAANQLLMHVLNQAYQKGVTMVSLPVDAETTAYNDLNRNKPNKGSFTWYVKQINEIPDIKRIYIDPLDI